MSHLYRIQQFFLLSSVLILLVACDQPEPKYNVSVKSHYYLNIASNLTKKNEKNIDHLYSTYATIDLFRFKINAGNHKESDSSLINNKFELSQASEEFRNSTNSMLKYNRDISDFRKELEAYKERMDSIIIRIPPVDYSIKEEKKVLKELLESLDAGRFDYLDEGDYYIEKELFIHDQINFEHNCGSLILKVLTYND